MKRQLGLVEVLVEIRREHKDLGAKTNNRKLDIASVSRYAARRYVNTKYFKIQHKHSQGSSTLAIGPK